MQPNPLRALDSHSTTTMSSRLSPILCCLITNIIVCNAAAQWSDNRADLDVTTILNEPFMIQAPQSNRLAGNERFTGFLADMLEILAKNANFTYVIRPVKDNKYGARVPSGEWNGMIGELLNGDADMAVADMTITSQREAVIDFTIPYLASGIGIIMRSTNQLPASLLDRNLIWAPFDRKLWVCIIVTFVGMSIATFIVARFSGERTSTSSDSTASQEQFSVSNSLFFILGSLANQTTNISPKSLPTRVLSITWWIFCLLTICVYIANLSAILVHHLDEVSHGPKIQSADDLSRQTTIQYGTLKGGSTEAFFKSSTIPTYQRIYATMEDAEPTVYAKSYADGLQKVFHEDYAMFMEGLAIDYLTERYCNLTSVGGLLDYKGYGIALKAGSPLRAKLNHGILKMQESGEIAGLYAKWWKNKDAECDKVEDDKSGRSAISVGNMYGVYVVLIVGTVAAVALAILQLFLRSRTSSRQQGGSVCDEVKREIRFAICGDSGKTDERSEDVILTRQDN